MYTSHTHAHTCAHSTIVYPAAALQLIIGVWLCDTHKCTYIYTDHDHIFWRVRGAFRPSPFILTCILIAIDQRFFDTSVQSSPTWTQRTRRNWLRESQATSSWRCNFGVNRRQIACSCICWRARARARARAHASCSWSTKIRLDIQTLHLYQCQSWKRWAAPTRRLWSKVSWHRHIAWKYFHRYLEYIFNQHNEEPAEQIPISRA